MLRKPEKRLKNCLEAHPKTDSPLLWRVSQHRKNCHHNQVNNQVYCDMMHLMVKNKITTLCIYERFSTIGLSDHLTGSKAPLQWWN